MINPSIILQIRGGFRLQAYIMVYDGFTEFEIILANYFIKTIGEIRTVGLTNQLITSFEGMQIQPHLTINQVNIDDVDIFIIPGGEPKELLQCNALQQLLIRLDKKQTPIAAICSGTIHLAKTHLLDHRHYTSEFNLDELVELDGAISMPESVVTDGHIITAKPNGYVDFAIEIGRKLKIFTDQADLDETIQFFKYFKA